MKSKQAPPFNDPFACVFEMLKIMSTTHISHEHTAHVWQYRQYYTSSAISETHSLRPTASTLQPDWLEIRTLQP